MAGRRAVKAGKAVLEAEGCAVNVGRAKLGRVVVCRGCD